MLTLIFDPVRWCRNIWMKRLVWRGVCVAPLYLMQAISLWGRCHLLHQPLSQQLPRTGAKPKKDVDWRKDF